MTSVSAYDDTELIFAQGHDLVEFYRQHPVLAAYDLLKVDLAPVQRIVLRDMWFKNVTISIMTRGGGKTFLLGVNAVLHCLLYPGYRVGLIAPSFRQSKLVFSEVEKLYSRSAILREACEKKPTRGADSCFLRFKPTGRTNGSYIEALPIGVDGAKIRGSRFYLIQIDELAQMIPEIIDMVIRPMAAVSLEPMERVREHERQEELIAQGLATADDFTDAAANKMIMTSSGYFKFNHMWKKMCTYWKALKNPAVAHKYAVHQIPYTLLPDKFLDEENIREAKNNMSRIEFMMEYEAAMVSDSDGFFKASLLDSSTINSGFSVQFNGEAGKEYIMGVDPNQGGNAACGIVIFELGSPHRIIFVKELKKKTTQQMVKEIQRLGDVFNIKRIFMDSQGGGNALKDLLEEGYDSHEPILDLDDEKNLGKKGKHILKMINPSSTWISDANFDALALLENKRLKFPEPPVSANPVAELLYEEVRKLKSQMLNIFVTQTARGVVHFDTPKKGQNKDLYSALVLASWGATEYFKGLSDTSLNVASQGLMRPHKPGAIFSRVAAISGNDYSKGAVLKRLN